MGLTRYWFRTRQGLGFGVTAFSLQDAQALLAQQWPASADSEVTEVVANIDVRTLDQNHVVVNMGPSSIRGVWYPCRNV